MAKDTLLKKAKSFAIVGGVDESVPLTSAEPTFASTNGAFPYFYGMHQRMLGKKIIDYNPDQKVSAICQTFNGVCLYGYYVETNNKLYFHLCDAPPDLRIHFWPN